ncbi:MAG TPA: YfiR family protein [Bacteroidia bacterium]|jgi:hypothetical protein
MRQPTSPYLLFVILIALTSCVSKKKFNETLKKSGQKDSLILAERSKLNLVNDSLRHELVLRDSIIDSLNFRLNDNSVRKEKDKGRSISAKKSTLTKAQEYEKKALFIYNFTKLIEWPIEYNGTEFKIGVAGDDKWIKELQEFTAQKKVSGKKIIVEKYQKGARYNVVYVTSSGMGNFSAVRTAVKKTKTLIVSDEAAPGTHISFILDHDKVRYLADKAAIEKAGMKVGQELMRYSG